MMNSTWLTSFLVFAEEVHFTRAAARLHISQPALHVQIAKLTEMVGARLYVRTGRSLELTRAGKELRAFARDLSERSDAFLTGLGAAAVVRSVVLAAGEGTLLYRLGPIIRRMSARPDVRLRVLTRDREGVLAALGDGEAHVGVLPLEVIPDGITATKLWRSGQMLVVPRGHQLARKRRVRLRDLDGVRLIVPPTARPHRAFVARALSSAGVRFEVAVEATGWEVMLHYVELGVGVAIVNDICRVPRGALARPLPELASLDYYVAQRTGLELSKPALDVKAMIRDLARG